MTQPPEIFVPHAGWLRHDADDEVALFLRQGWFEGTEQALAWLYLRPGDVFIDGGAHVGLFSLLAGRAVGAGGRVISIEPAPTTTQLLRHNLQTNGIDQALVIEAALADHEGAMNLHRNTDGRSAYNSLSGDDDGPAVQVQVTTVDALVEKQQLAEVAFLKLDVEGFEVLAWRGAGQTIAQRKVALVMIEFTEANLHKAGFSTMQLAQAVQESGYHLCRFDSQKRELIPVTVTQEIGYENLFAVRDLAGANDRIAQATVERQRIAEEILRRTQAGQAALETEDLRRRCAGLEKLSAINLERATNSEQAHEQTARNLHQTQLWLRASSDQLKQTQQQLEQQNQQLQQVVQQNQSLQQRLWCFVTSRYEQWSWKLGVRKKPQWVDEFIAAHMPRR